MLKTDTYMRWTSTIHNIYTTLAHIDYPHAPESLVIGSDMYSPAQHAAFPQAAPQRKLTPNLKDKVRYVVHYRNLKLYLQMGLIVTQIHMVLKLKQPTWLKTYIDFNSQQRSSAMSSFLKNFFKLMNNSLFGATQENLRKRVQVELITDAGILRKRIVKPNFCWGKPITDCLSAKQCTETTPTLNRPIYVGFSVLHLSKFHMYSFHYNHMCVKYPRPDQFRLLFTDTDSLAYAVQTEDIKRDMVADAATHYDFSEYTLDHPLYSAMNRKAIGFFKDELNSVHMHQFVGLRPKCYAFLCTGKVSNNMLQHTNPVEKKTAKDVKRWVKDAHLHFGHYLDALKNFHAYLCRQNLAYCAHSPYVQGMPESIW